MYSPPLIDFDETLKDSPKFRCFVRQHELYLSQFEARINDVVKLCNNMIDAGKVYMTAFHSLLAGLSKFNDVCFKYDTEVYGNFDSLIGVFAELLKFQKVLIEQAHWSVCRNLSDYLKRDIHKTQEVRFQFEKVSNSMDASLTACASVPKNKEAEVVDARNELTAVGTCFAHTALDYAFMINQLQTTRRYEILDSLLSFARACSTYFHQGSDLFAEWDPVKSRMTDTIAGLKDKSRAIEKKMQDRHSLVPKEIFQHPPSISVSDSQTVMEGYLFKRAKKGFKHWKRRWFVIRHCKVLYRKRETELSPNSISLLAADPAAFEHIWTSGYSVMESDLRICLVRPAPPNVDRRNCFELVTPTIIHVFQADSPSICQAWIKALARSIESAIHDGVASLNNPSFDLPNSFSQEEEKIQEKSTKTLIRIVDEIMAIPGNRNCADCGAENPKWASVNLGITLCIACCGIHRGLSVQISKTRSLTMDAWEPETVRMMKALGNTVVNKIYLAFADQLLFPTPPKSNSPNLVRDVWIRAKYVEKRFCHPLSPPIMKRSRSDRNYNLKESGDTTMEPLKQIAEKVADRPRRAKSMAQDVELEDNNESPIDPAVVKHSALSCPDLSNFLSLNKDSTSNGLLTNPRRSKNREEFRVDHQNRKLYECVEKCDLSGMVQSVALGASVCGVDIANGETALHKSVSAAFADGSEYLLQNGAVVNFQDFKGRTPLHVACLKCFTGQVCQLLKRGAEPDVKDQAGFSPLDYAMNATNADIVTLLRLAKLNMEIKSSDEGSQIEPTFRDVVTDFSAMANDNPERLTLNREANKSVP